MRSCLKYTHTCVHMHVRTSTYMPPHIHVHTCMYPNIHALPHTRAHIYAMWKDIEQSHTSFPNSPLASVAPILGKCCLQLVIHSTIFLFIYICVCVYSYKDLRNQFFFFFIPCACVSMCMCACAYVRVCALSQGLTLYPGMASGSLCSPYWSHTGHNPTPSVF